MQRRMTLALSILAFSLCLAFAGLGTVDAQTRPGATPTPATKAGTTTTGTPARAGGPELVMVAGALGTLGASAIGAGVFLRRRKHA